MNHILGTILAVGMIWTVAADDAPWWNKNYQRRAKITLNAGMQPGKNPIAAAQLVASKQIKISLQRIRLIDAAGREVPCVLKKDSTGNWFIGWRPEKLKLLEKRTYYAYFAQQAQGVSPAPSNMPENLPGMNLIPSADFQTLDADGHPVGWAMSSRGYGRKDQWTAANKKQMQLGKLDGRQVLQLQKNAVVHVKVAPGRQYEIAVEGQSQAQSNSISVWYRGETISRYLTGISNYKMPLYLPNQKNPDWVQKSQATFIFQDKKTGRIAHNNKFLLPGTHWAFIQMNVKNGTFNIARISFEDITDRGSIRLKVSPVETYKK